ncbi:MAG: TIGR02677 family protein, partial [Acidobacteriota bacterium]|nr:TIGR02677 family protein [Acidobacteriota bacterium]
MSQLSVFAHVTAVNAPLYRTVMTAFHRAREQFVLHLRPDDVLISLREAGFFQRPVQGDEDEPAPMDRDYVSELLKRLWDWGNLRAFQDTAEVATVDEFMRKRFLYQMTPEGEAAEAALAVFEEHLARPGELQTTALEDIQLNLAALEKLAADKEPDAARVASLLGELSRRFADLTGQAQRFMGGLQRHIDLYEVEIDVFMAYKEMLLDYLDRFIRELVVATSRITGLLLRLEDRHISRLLHLTAERELKDVLNPTDSEREQRQRNWESRWQGLRSWFIAATGQKSQAEVLRGRALQAIPDLISVVAAINERRTTRGDRLADLRVLARWFAECDSDADAHRLWRAAFGLHQARHLRINADTLAKWEEK